MNNYLTTQQLLNAAIKHKQDTGEDLTAKVVFNPESSNVFSTHTLRINNDDIVTETRVYDWGIPYNTDWCNDKFLDLFKFYQWEITTESYNNSLSNPNIACVLRDNEVLYIGTVEDCNRAEAMLIRNNSINALSVTVNLPTEQGYISKCLDPINRLMYGN